MLKTWIFFGTRHFLRKNFMVFPAAQLHSVGPSKLSSEGWDWSCPYSEENCPFYPLQPVLLRSASPIFLFGVVKFCGPIHWIQQKPWSLSPEKRPFRWPRLSENAAQSDMSASGLRLRSWSCNRVATCATERTPGVNQIQGHAPKTVGMP